MRGFWFIIVATTPALFSGCLFFGGGGGSAPAAPTGDVIVHDHLVVHGDFDIPRRHPLLDELVGQRRTMSRRLKLPLSKEPVHIYLFDAAEKYDAFMARHYPRFPDRRAFFVDDGVQLAVYAQWGDHREEDLRHEVAHGYLHAVIPTIPLWIDEGLAEYFETPHTNHHNHRVHPEHAPLLKRQLQQGLWRPDLQQLEQLTSADQMIQIDYAEGWAWTHWLLHSSPKTRTQFQEYLGELKQGQPVTPLSVRIREIVDSPENALIEHLASLSVD